MAEALTMRGVSAGYGETVVLEDVDLSIAAGESLSIVGRNGVGKSTLLATVMGHTTLHKGAMALFGNDLASLPIHRRARAGIGYVPQEREIFPSLTVRENLTVGARPGPWTLDRVFALFSQLAARAGNRGDQLSGGEQQMLSVARALMGNPQLLLMDEPTEGLAPIVVQELAQAMRRVRAESDMAIVLVEQNLRVAFAFSPRATVVNRGRIVYDGSSAALAADKARLDSLIGVAT